MQYKLTQIRILSGTTKRPGSQFDGQKYEWIQARLYNDLQPSKNRNPLPRYYIFDQTTIDMYKECATQDPNAPETLLVNENDLKEKYPQLTHVGLVFKYAFPLTAPYMRIYNRDIINATTGQKTHSKGEPVVNEQGEITPVTVLTLYLEKMADPDLPNQSVEDMAWVEEPHDAARRVLERNYKLYENPKPAANIAPTPAAPEAPETPAQSPEEEAAALRAKLAALGQQ